MRPVTTPDVLAEAPELAALEILEQAGDTAVRSLVAAHPELNSGDFLEHERVTARVCLAAAVVAALRALDDAIDNYRVYVERLARLPGRADEDF